MASIKVVKFDTCILLDYFPGGAVGPSNLIDLLAAILGYDIHSLGARDRAPHAFLIMTLITPSPGSGPVVSYALGAKGLGAAL